MAKILLTDEQRAEKKAAADKARRENNKAAAAKMKEEMAAKKAAEEAKKEEAPAEEDKKEEAPTPPAAPIQSATLTASVLTDEAAAKAAKVTAHLKTHFYNTAGTKMEIGPNLMDLQFNQFIQAGAIWDMVKAAGIMTTNMKTGRNTTINYSETAGEAFKDRGTIQVLRYRPKGHEEDNFITFLKANQDIKIKVLTRVHYPYSKAAAREEGRDNREYTYGDIQEITIKAGTAIPLAITTNYNKTLAYSNKYSQLYKVYFPTSTYGKNPDLFQSEGDLLNLWAPMTKIGGKTFNTLGQTTMIEELGITSIMDFIPILLGETTAI